MSLRRERVTDWSDQEINDAGDDLASELLEVLRAFEQTHPTVEEKALAWAALQALTARLDDALSVIAPSRHPARTTIVAMLAGKLVAANDQQALGREIVRSAQRR